MNRLPEEDLIKLNAFHDGEMPEESEAFARRLETEPELRAALADIQQVSASLKAMRPKTEQRASAQNDNRRWLWWVGSALAGSIALAYFLGMSSHRPDPNGRQTAIALHENFTGQAFVSHNKVFTTVTGKRMPEFPDLSAANLTLVAIKDIPRGSAAHFAGREGCRLTVLSSEVPISGTEHQPALQSAGWSVQDRFYTIVATDMDAGKFAAITAYLEQATRKMAEPKTIIALKQATAHATSCG